MKVYFFDEMSIMDTARQVVRGGQGWNEFYTTHYSKNTCTVGELNQKDMHK